MYEDNSPTKIRRSVACLSQGGAVFELFSGHGKDPVGKWKLYGGPPAIYKVSLTALVYTGYFFIGLYSLKFKLTSIGNHYNACSVMQPSTPQLNIIHH